MDWVEFRHSGQSLPHTHKAHWNSDVVSKCGAEPPLPSDTECIIILCVYYFTADCLVSIVPAGMTFDMYLRLFWPYSLGALAKLGVCYCQTRMTCHLPTTYNTRDMMASWWMCSPAIYTHTRLKVFASIVAHLLSAWPRPWKQFINHTGSVRTRERDRRLWWKKRGTVEEGHRGFWQKRVPL